MTDADIWYGLSVRPRFCRASRATYLEFDAHERLIAKETDRPRKEYGGSMDKPPFSQTKAA